MNTRPVHFLMFSFHLFFRLYCLLPPFTVPCKTVLARPDERETCPCHCSLRLFTIVGRSSCVPIACWILSQTSSLVTWSLYKMRSILLPHFHGLYSSLKLCFLPREMSGLHYDELYTQEKSFSEVVDDEDFLFRSK